MSFLFPACLETELYHTEDDLICISQVEGIDQIIVRLTIKQAKWLLEHLPQMIEEAIDHKLLNEVVDEADS